MLIIGIKVVESGATDFDRLAEPDFWITNRNTKAIGTIRITIALIHESA